MTRPPEAATERSSAHQEKGASSQEGEGCVPLPQGAERQAQFLACAADAGYRDCSCSSAEREAESHACKSILFSVSRELMPNPSLKRSANGSPPGPVRGAIAFSTARAWRPAAVARLARTLGIRKSATLYSRRKCACRRESNSHEAARPQIRVSAGRKLEAIRATDGAGRSNILISARAGVSAGQSKRTMTPPEAAKWVQQRACGRPVSARMSGQHTNSGQESRLPASARNRAKDMRLWPALQGAERPARFVPCAADAEYRDCSCRSAEREAESLADKLKQSVGRPRA